MSLLCASLALMAQEETKVKGAHPYKLAENDEVATKFAHWSIIPHVGFNAFDGDFNTEMKHAVSYPDAGLAVEYSFTPVWSVGVDYMFSRYGVTGKGGKHADVLLRGFMHQAGAYISMDVITLFFPRAKRKIVNIEPYGGAGFAWYRNEVMYNDASRGNTAAYVWDDGTVGPKSMDKYSTAPFIRAGMNVEFNLNRTLALGIRAQYNYFLNDYVDNRGFSGPQSIASKGNDGIIDVTLNMRIKIAAVSKTHERNVVREFPMKSGEVRYVHDTVVVHHDSVIVRELYKEIERQIAEPRKEQQIYYVYFNSNKSNLDDKGLITIQQVADAMKEDSSLYAVVTGYCDNTGSEKLNYALGDKRAGNVLGELREEHAIDADHLYAMGMGKLTGHRSQAAYGPNRRAVIRLVDKDTFERMKADLDGKHAQREVEKETAQPQRVEKTIPLNESARREKVNTYKKRPNEEVVVDKTTTLARLARQYYNNTYCWVYIYIANKDKISNPNALTQGVKLIIPELTEKEMHILKDESLLLYGKARQEK